MIACIKLRSIILGLLVVTSMVFWSSVWAVTVGQKAPDIKVKSLKDNGVVDLEHYAGKVVLVDFWASWCPPCKKSLPLFNELRRKFGEDKFEVIAINMDTNKSDAMAFLAHHPVDYPVGWDPEGNTPEVYNAPGMPTSYLLDQNGLIKKIHIGFKEKDIAKYEQEIRQLLSM